MNSMKTNKFCRTEKYRKLFYTDALGRISGIFPMEIWNWIWDVSVQFSHSVMSDSLWTHGLQHSRFPCPSPTPRACSNSCSLIWWSHPTISSCLPLLLLPSIFPSITDSFPMSQFFSSGDQSIGASASASVLPMNSQDWFPLGWTGWISLLS